jgi:transposase
MARTTRELTDAQRAKLAPLLLPQRPRMGHPPKDHRLIVEAIVWLDRTGTPWRDLPSQFGPWETVASRFTAGAARASGTGSWPRCRPTRTPAASWTGCCTLWTGRWCGPTSTLPVPGGGRPRPTWTQGALVDPDQPGDRDREALGRSRGGYSTKLHLRVEGRGRPMVILATAGQRHEALMLRKLMEAGRSSGRVGAGRGSGRPRWLVTRATAT